MALNLKTEISLAAGDDERHPSRNLRGVPPEQQAAAHTIESQLVAPPERARGDGTNVPSERQYVDDGYSGATRVRPARLRDHAATRTANRIYVHPSD
jgi:site-specific DNA recombinase